MIIALLLLVTVSPEALSEAIKHVSSAQAEAMKSPQCQVATQIKATRMQLELMQEVKDYAGAETMAASITELEAEAKGTCGELVAKALSSAATRLKGGAPEPEDQELEPEPLAPIATRPPAAVSQMKRELNDVAKMLGRAWKPAGEAKESDEKRFDLTQTLALGRCYAFVGVASPAAKRLALYLFDPAGKKRAWKKSRDATAIIYFCPFMAGDYVVQAKVKVRGPDKRAAVGTYVREP